MLDGIAERSKVSQRRHTKEKESLGRDFLGSVVGDTGEFSKCNIIENSRGHEV